VVVDGHLDVLDAAMTALPKPRRPVAYWNFGKSGDSALVDNAHGYVLQQWNTSHPIAIVRDHGPAAKLAGAVSHSFELMLMFPSMLIWVLLVVFSSMLVLVLVLVLALGCCYGGYWQ
jgi:hypothetical protein